MFGSLVLLLIREHERLTRTRPITRAITGNPANLNGFPQDWPAKISGYPQFLAGTFLGLTRQGWWSPVHTGVAVGILYLFLPSRQRQRVQKYPLARPTPCGPLYLVELTPNL